MFYALPKVLCSNKHFPFFWQIRHPLKLKFNETATELFNHGSKDRETLTSKQNKKINKINTESVQLHSWLRTASLLLHWQKEKKNPLTYLDSSNHENKRKKNSWKFETLTNNNDDNTLGPKLFALNGIENTFQ